MTVQDAIKNISIVVQNARMTGPEHDALKESISLIARRCLRADMLEDQALKDSVPDENPKEEKDE